MSLNPKRNNLVRKKIKACVTKSPPIGFHQCAEVVFVHILVIHHMTQLCITVADPCYGYYPQVNS